MANKRKKVEKKRQIYDTPIRMITEESNFKEKEALIA
jgi:hypothetical protein